MTKTARVILIFFNIFFFFVFTFPVTAGFADLIKPIPDEPTTNDQLLTTNSPSITFGDLLNISPTDSLDITPVADDEAEIAAKTARFKILLARLEENYKESLAQFREKQATLPRDIPYDIAHPSPTPFIPVSALIAGVSELTTYNSQPTTIYPTPTLTDQLLVASIPTAFPVSNSTNLSNLNNLGNLSQNPPKNSYTVALLGDSMTDTLGRSLPQLRDLLQKAYPTKFFSLLNYGQGATDLESGINRLTNTTNYLGVSYPPLLSYKPDILVVESFAYNHWSGEKYDLDRQWLSFAKIVDTLKANSPETKIVFAASIAPNKDVFGDGVLNWPASLKENSTLITKAYLQNLVNFATSGHFPLADAYHPSLDVNGNGINRYINSYDHLHPSGEGAYLYSKEIVEAIKANGLIN